MPMQYADLSVDEEYLDRSYDGATVAYTEENTRMQPMVQSFRDRLRASAGADWQVSDIATWVGGSGSQQNFMIRVRRMIAGTPQGFEFVLFIGGRGTSGSYSGNARWMVNGDIRTYVGVRSDYYYSGKWSPAVFFHNSADTKTFLGGWDSLGTLSGGDFSTVISNGGTSPYVNFVTFLNTCQEFDGAILPSYANNGHSLLVTLLPEQNCAMFWAASSFEIQADTVFICGDIADVDLVANPTDTRPEGCIYWQRAATTNAISSEECQFKNAAGVITKDYTVSTNTSKIYNYGEALGLTPPQGNAPREDNGVFSSLRVPLSSPGYSKGWIKSSVCLEMGSGNVNIFRQQHLRIFSGRVAGEKFVKWSRDLSIAFPADIPFPFIGYPLTRS